MAAKRGSKAVPTVTMNIKREYFAAILSIPRRKFIEYRDLSEFWETRLALVRNGKFRLRLLNGMTHPVPEALIVVNRLERDRRVGEFRLHLGRVLSVKNWDRVKEVPIEDEN